MVLVFTGYLFKWIPYWHREGWPDIQGQIQPLVWSQLCYLGDEFERRYKIEPSIEQSSLSCSSDSCQVTPFNTYWDTFHFPLRAPQLHLRDGKMKCDNQGTWAFLVCCHTGQRSLQAPFDCTSSAWFTSSWILRAGLCSILCECTRWRESGRSTDVLWRAATHCPIVFYSVCPSLR